MEVKPETLCGADEVGQVFAASYAGAVSTRPRSAWSCPGSTASFDVYAAAAAGLVHCEFETYTDLAGHPVYGRRMREHAVRGFAGQLCAEYLF
ncbi:hypothetical protein LTT66_35020 [Nocardia gipuzkoensis]|uniref:hypothetical protein n=1 Tax=Nocardia gipuzkoensis TaxID=2749991 RepID=UPI001E5DE8D0|nr:hypothetical protein [Nocardia gipuzkoensis]UGT68302.1 hypothetical protein LTT66_35020 [Nocardia gipuzkoensis]